MVTGAVPPARRRLLSVRLPGGGPRGPCVPRLGRGFLDPTPSPTAPCGALSCRRLGRRAPDTGAPLAAATSLRQAEVADGRARRWQLIAGRGHSGNTVRPGRHRGSTRSRQPPRSRACSAVRATPTPPGPTMRFVLPTGPAEVGVDLDVEVDRQGAARSSSPSGPSPPPSPARRTGSQVIRCGGRTGCPSVEAGRRTNARSLRSTANHAGGRDDLVVGERQR